MPAKSLLRASGRLLFALTLLASLLPVPASLAMPGRAPVTLTGTAAAGLIVGGTVQVFPVTGGAIGGTALGQATTDAAGSFSITLADAPTGPVVVQVTGGQFRDEATQQQQTLPIPLRTGLPSLTTDSFVAITPITEAAVRFALSRGALSANNIWGANQAATNYLFNVDAVPTRPADPTDPASGTGTPQQKAVGLALGAISQYRLSNSATLDTVTGIVSQTLQIGGTLLSGGGGFPEHPTGDPLIPEDLRLLDAFNDFVGNPALNKTGIATAYQLYQLLGLTTNPGGTPGAPWTAACQDSVSADFAARDALPPSPLPVDQWQTPAAYNGGWGPDPTIFPIVTIPTGCDPTMWQQQRIVATIDHVISKNYNYCHHHVPEWTLPAQYQSATSTNCAHNRTPMVWQGMDCSNFSAYTYNYGLGGWRMDSETNQQAGQPNPSPTTPPMLPTAANDTFPLAAGQLLKDPSTGQYITFQNIESNLSVLQPGDLLYIIGYGVDIQTTQLYTVAHVIHWTGLTVQQLGVNRIVPEYQAFAQPTDYVIADSHYAGPGYRPFHGPWTVTPQVPTTRTYANHLWGVRRIITAQQPTTPTATPVVPELPPALLFGSGLLALSGLAAASRRRRR